MRQCIGIDIHRKFIQVCVMDEQGNDCGQARLEMEAAEEMTRVFSAFPEGTQVAVEATMAWGWLSDLLEDLGLEVHLAHMRGVRVIAESRCKTDKIDARVLADLLRTNFLPEAYLAPRELRDKRLLLRHRQSLIRWRTCAKNAVHGLLTRYNIHLEATDIFGKKGVEHLRALELGSPADTVLENLLAFIEHTNGLIKKVDRKLASVLESDPRVDLLRSLPGVGKLTAYFLLGEIGTIDRFRSPAKLVSYCGLCPSTRQSASMVYHGSCRGSGRPLLKWALVEAAHTAVRRESYFATIFHREKRKGKNKKAYVAVARRMAQVIWAMLKEDRSYIPKVKKTRLGSVNRLTDRTERCKSRLEK